MLLCYKIEIAKYPLLSQQTLGKMHLGIKLNLEKGWKTGLEPATS